MSLHVFDIIQSRRQWVVDVDDDDLPIGFFLIEQGHYAKYFHLFDLTRGGHELTNFADVQRIIIAFCFGLRMDDIRIFPSLPTT